MDLFSVMHATWPAERSWRVGPYTVRDGAGGGGRASAATLDGPFADPAPAIVAQREYGIRPLFMVREGEDALDAALAAQGLAFYNPTMLMAAPVSRVAARVSDVATIRCDGLMAVLVELWEHGGIGDGRRRAMERVETAKLYFLGRLDDRSAGAAFAARSDGVVMLHALHVAAWARRRGLGARLTRDAAAWGAEGGAKVVSLAVARANVPAYRLYSGLGFVEGPCYHYRIAPAPVE